MSPDRMRRPRAFTLLELLIVSSIISLIMSILVPALNAARASGQAVKCLANLRSIAAMTQTYLDTNEDKYPVRDNTVLGGGNLYNSFLPSRLIMRQDRRPLELFTCAADREGARNYPVGDGTDAFPDSMGIGDIYALPPDAFIRYSYGINNMTGINPETESDRKLFNPHAGAYKRPAETLMYADSAYFNIRPSNLTLNDEPRLKGRVPNASAPTRMNSLPAIPPEYGIVQPDLRRHKGGSNVMFMDHHGAMVSQKDCFEKILHSWTERYGTDTGAP